MTGPITYGIHAARQLLTNQDITVELLYLQATSNNKRLHELATLAQSRAIAIEYVTKHKLDSIAGKGHQGVALKTQAQGQNTSIEDIVATYGDKTLILVLDGIQDPHNLGACLRTADAVGVHAVIIGKNNACGITATVQKVACGGADSVPVITVTNIARSLEQLKKLGLWSIGLTEEADHSIYQQDFQGPKAIVMGGEGPGLRRLTKEKCDFLAHIPMQGQVASLNVSVATGVVLYEALRQRQIKLYNI